MPQSRHKQSAAFCIDLVLLCSQDRNEHLISVKPCCIGYIVLYKSWYSLLQLLSKTTATTNNLVLVYLNAVAPVV